MSETDNSFALDEDLMRDAHLLARCEGKAYDRLRKLIEDFEVAFKLSNGPIPGRSAFWRVRALDAQSRLRGRVESLKAGKGEAGAGGGSDSSTSEEDTNKDPREKPR